MNIYEIINRIQIHLEPILNESGSVVFSSVDTINKGDIYTLGLNPGGKVDITINDTLNELPKKKRNAYIDESWGNGKNSDYIPGKHPLQHNYTGLIHALGYDPKDVFSTNLIFTRSQGQYGAYYPERANICWKAHQEFIKIIDPKYFIVFGNSRISPFQYIKNKYSLEISDSFESGHGIWKCFSCFGEIEGKKRVLIGVPHLSRYYIVNHENVIQWIISKLI
jgi:hypothetical protein